MMTLNKNKEEFFQNGWQYYIQTINKNKLPERPGPGWLQVTAARYDLCTAIFHDENKSPVVCGMPIKGDPYFCPNCLELIGKMSKNPEIKQTYWWEK